MSLSGVAKETLAIIDAGRYSTRAGRSVEIRAAVDAAVRGTELLRPEELDRMVAALAGTPGTPPPRLEVTSETTGAAARRLVQREGRARVLALNFASAKNPGGGFLGGAKAQEEDLARCSALYTCQLTQRAFYDTHRASPSMLYSDHMIYSPDVPFFRDEAGALLDEPFLVSVITSPAPNAGEADLRGDEAEVAPTLMTRARKILALAAARKHRHLVLGAWGCGVFRNDPTEVAEAFAQVLEPTFAGAFDQIVFAVYERHPEGPNLSAFRRRFG